jgi:hypothetical protein
MSLLFSTPTDDALAGCEPSGICEWCKKHSDRLAPMADVDEGFLATYCICGACRSKERQAHEDELSGNAG